jgi:hypothetical protein
MIKRRVLVPDVLVSPTGFPQAEVLRAKPPRPGLVLHGSGDRLLGKLNARTVRYRATNNNIGCHGVK